MTGVRRSAAGTAILLVLLCHAGSSSNEVFDDDELGEFFEPLKGTHIFTVVAAQGGITHSEK